jgi:nickel/cobalt transporter (NicO) family protein
MIHKSALFEYIKKHTEFRDDEWKLCSIGDFSAELTGIDDLFIKGFPVEYIATCNKPLASFGYKLQIYTHLPLQTNRVSIYDWKSWNRLSYKVLTAKIDTAIFQPGNIEKPLDTDKDLLPDEEESIYRTDPNNADTDRDFYSDYEEVMYGWNPLEARLSPGQIWRTQARDGDITLPDGIVQNHTKSIPQNPTNSDGLFPVNQDTLYTSSWDQTLLDRVTFWYYRSVLKELESIRKNGMNTPQLLLVWWVLFLLWFLHALGPGHSKGFMSAYIVGSNASLSSSLAYAALFTCIHLLDVVWMIIVLKFLDGVIDIQSFLVDIMKIGVIILLSISTILFYKSLRVFLKSRDHNTSTTGYTPVTRASWKSGIYMAAFTWLAPCSFAWSILLILFAIWRIDLILPLIAFFWFGVLVALAWVATIVYFLREWALRYLPRKFVNIFPLISSLFLVVFSCFFASIFFL